MGKHATKLAAAMMAALCLCAAPVCAAAAQAVTKPALTAAADAGTPAGTVQLALEAVKAVDIEAFNRLTDNVRKDGTYATGMTIFGDSEGELSDGDKKLAEELFRNLSWTMGAVAQSGNTATVPLKITNADFTSVVGTVSKEAMAGVFATETGETDSMDRMMELVMAAQKNTAITIDVTAKAVKTDGAWKVHLDHDLVNAVCGNMLAGVDQYMEEFSAFIKEYMLKNEALQKQIAEEIQNEIDKALKEAFK